MVPVLSGMSLCAPTAGDVMRGDEECAADMEGGDTGEDLFWDYAQAQAHAQAQAPPPTPAAPPPPQHRWGSMFPLELPWILNHVKAILSISILSVVSKNCGVCPTNPALPFLMCLKALMWPQSGLREILVAVAGRLHKQLSLGKCFFWPASRAPLWLEFLVLYSLCLAHSLINCQGFFFLLWLYLVSLHTQHSA